MKTQYRKPIVEVEEIEENQPILKSSRWRDVPPFGPGFEEDDDDWDRDPWDDWGKGHRDDGGRGHHGKEDW